MAISPEIANAIWYRALESEIGIAVETTDPKAMREELNDYRRTAADPELDKLMTFLPNGVKEVWIVKKETEL